MANKFNIVNGRAPGYWGRDIRCRIASDFTVDKVASQNYDKIIAMGLPYTLWREANSMIADAIKCSCFKDTSKQPDIPCLQCYGTGFVPGYLKFGTQNFWSAADSLGAAGTGGFGQDAFTAVGTWTLSSTVLDKTNRPFRIMLAAGATSGTAISPNLLINPTALAKKVGPWDAKADGFTRDGIGNSTIVVEASRDNGATWFALAAIDAQSPTTQLRFRVTMTRTAVGVKTPMFEIARARFVTMRDIDYGLAGAVDEPVIRVIPTWDQEAEIRQNAGNKMENTSKRFWTLPLTFFNLSLARETPAARVMDDCLVEVRYGGEIGFRYALVEFSYSDTFGTFTRQEFGMRRIAGNPGKIPGEVYYRVFQNMASVQRSSNGK